MNKLVVVGLLLAVALGGGFFTKKGSYIPVIPGKQNVINFGCGIGDSYSNVAGVSSAGYTFTYSGLPSWVGVVNGPMIAGTPTGTTPTAIQVYYTDSNGNQGSQVVVLAPTGTNANTLVNLPTGGFGGIAGFPAGSRPGSPNTPQFTVNGYPIPTAGSNGPNANGPNGPNTNEPNGPSGQRIPVSQLPPLQYVPGSTSPAPGSNPNGNNPYGNNPNGNNPNGNNPYGNNPDGNSPNNPNNNGPDTSLITVVLPALVYPTPGRISIIPPDAPTTGAQRPSAPATNPEEDAAIMARQEAAMKGLANAMDALNKANTNFNNLQNQVGNSQNDLNSALNYLQNTRNALRDAQNQQSTSNTSIITVTRDISNLQSQIDAANNDIASLNANINDLQNNLNNAGPTVAAYQTTLENIIANITAVTNAAGDTQSAIDGANIQITTLRKIITDTQYAIDNWPAAVAKVQKDINVNNDRVDRARKELDDALAEQAALKANYDQLQTIKTNGPRIISETTDKITQIKNLIQTQTNKLNGFNGQLANLNNGKNNATANIDNTRGSVGDLSKKLIELKKALADRQTALTRYQSQLNQATATVTQLRTNGNVLNDNVNTLLEQLGLAENNVNNARAASDDLATQIKNAQNLIDATKVALERARTEKALSDQEINESIQRQGGTFRYPYIPGTGPYAMPGVTGNPATGTANPYAPGTIFGTGPGTTGRGPNSGLPLSAAPGSPYASLGNPANGASGSRLISAAQAGNVSPSSLYPAGSAPYQPGTPGFQTGQGLYPTIGNIGNKVGTPDQGAYPGGNAGNGAGYAYATAGVVGTNGFQVGAGAVTPLGGAAAGTGFGGAGTGFGGNGAGAGGCFASLTSAGANVLSGAGRIIEIGDNWYALQNGYKVYTAPCTSGCKGKVGDNVNWNGYNQQGTFLATKLSCS